MRLWDLQSIIDTVHILCDLLQYRIETHVVNSEEEIAPTLEQLKKQGITLVFGDTLTHEIAGEMGMNAVFINSGAESIHEAFRQVIQMFNTFSMFDSRVHLLEDAHEAPNLLQYHFAGRWQTLFFLL